MKTPLRQLIDTYLDTTNPPSIRREAWREIRALWKQRSLTVTRSWRSSGAVHLTQPALETLR